MTDDKPAALLTNTQRDYLNGDSVTPHYERQLRDNIHDRIEATMGDFLLLFNKLEQEDVREAFGSNVGQRIGRDHEKFERAVERVEDPKEIDEEDVEEDTRSPRGTAGTAPGAIAFLLRGLNYGEQPIVEYLEDTDNPQPAFEHFIEIVEQGISLYLRAETNYTARVSVEINLEGLTPDDELLESADSE